MRERSQRGNSSTCFVEYVQEILQAPRTTHPRHIFLLGFRECCQKVSAPVACTIPSRSRWAFANDRRSEATDCSAGTTGRFVSKPSRCQIARRGPMLRSLVTKDSQPSHRHCSSVRGASWQHRHFVLSRVLIVRFHLYSRFGCSTHHGLNRKGSGDSAVVGISLLAANASIRDCSSDFSTCWDCLKRNP